MKTAVRTAVASADGDPRYPDTGENWRYRGVSVLVVSCRVAKNGSVHVEFAVDAGEKIELRVNKHAYNRLLNTGELTTYGRPR